MQFGVNLIAQAALPRYNHRLIYRKIADRFEQLHGLNFRARPRGTRPRAFKPLDASVSMAFKRCADHSLLRSYLLRMWNISSSPKRRWPKIVVVRSLNSDGHHGSSVHLISDSNAWSLRGSVDRPLRRVVCSRLPGQGSLYQTSTCALSIVGPCDLPAISSRPSPFRSTALASWVATPR